MKRITAEEYKALHIDKQPKYRNKKIASLDGVFDSKKEFDRWRELKLLEKAGLISGLRRQVSYELIPAQRDERGKVIERAVRYVADYAYERDGVMVVEDVKSEITRKNQAYVLKRKLMLERHNQHITEV